MRTENIDFEKFITIEDVYTFIEKNAFEIEQNWELTNLWIKFKDRTKDEVEKQNAQWEVECHLFNISGDKLFSPIYSKNDNSDDVSKYPDLEKFQQSTLEYIKARAENSINPIIKSRYNHILWKHPSIKNNKFALIALENYYASIYHYSNEYISSNKQEDASEIGRLFEMILIINDKIKSDRQKLLILSKHLLFGKLNLEFHIIHDILKDMLDYPKLFKPKDFDNTLALFEKELKKEKVTINDFLFTNYRLPTAIKIATKTKSDVKIWFNELGLAYLRLAEEEKEEDRYWLKQDYHSKAIESFKKAGHNEHKKLAEQLYSDLKPKIKLSLVKIPFSEDLQKKLAHHQDNLKKEVEKLLQMSPDRIYQEISAANFFPSYEEIEKLALSKRKNSLLEFATTIQFDNNKNISTESHNNKDLNEIFESFKIHLNTSTLPYLHYLIIGGISSGKLTYSNFINYLISNTWIGKTIIEYDLAGNEKPFNWIQHLSPSIIEFFIQVQAWNSTKYYKPSFILSIDSLTLKMEGLFRDFCKRASIPTSLNREKGMQEAYLSNIFDNDIIKEFFNANDRLLFDYLFSNEGGLNLRNNVAHCFLSINEYNPDKMLLLIAALLRLGKYDHKKIKAQQPTSVKRK